MRILLPSQSPRRVGSLSLTLSRVASVLISVKIWHVQREVDRYSPAVSALRPKRLRAGSRLMLVIVESGEHLHNVTALGHLLDWKLTRCKAAIYSMFLILLIVMSVVGAPGMLAMLNLVCFSTILLSVHSGPTGWLTDLNDCRKQIAPMIVCRCPSK